MFRSWLKQPRSTRPRRVRLAVDLLEARSVPSTTQFTMTTDTSGTTVPVTISGIPNASGTVVPFTKGQVLHFDITPGSNDPNDLAGLEPGDREAVDIASSAGANAGKTLPSMADINHNQDFTYTIVQDGETFTFSASDGDETAKINLTVGQTLSFTQEPHGAAPNGNIGPIAVQVLDVNGKPDGSALGQTVTLSILVDHSAMGNAKLSGTLTAPVQLDSQGRAVATFPSVSIDQPGLQYVVMATLNAGTPSATSADSSPGFNVGHALKIATPNPATPNQSLTTGNPAGSLTVEVDGPGPNGVPDTSADGGTVTASLGTGQPGGPGTLSGTLTATIKNGVATFDNLQITKPGTGYDLHFALADGTSGDTLVDVSHLVDPIQPPTDLQAGVITPRPIQILVLGPGGAIDPTGVPVTVTIGTNPGGGALQGTTTASTAKGTGIAVFSDLAIDKPGTGYTLVFSLPDGASFTSEPFNVTSGVPAPAAPVVTKDPVNATVCAPDDVSFTASVTSVPVARVQWQVSSDGGASFSDIDASQTPSAEAYTLVIPTDPSEDGNQYRAVFQQVQGPGIVASKAATLTVQTDPTVTTPPADQAVVVGQTAMFTVLDTGSPTPTIQWQESTDNGASFNNLTDGTGVSGATTNTLVLSNVPITSDGHLFRAQLLNACVTTPVSSPTAVLSVSQPVAPATTTDPTNQTVTEGQTAIFTAAASGKETPTVQWQVSTDGGQTFSNITNNFSATTPTLILSGVTFAQNGSEFQAVFTNSAGTVTTKAATLQVNTVPVVTLNPVSQTALVGSSATFSAAATSQPGPTVQWQVSSDGGKTFNNVPGAIGTVLTVPANSSANGTLYRAVFTNVAGSAITMNATLTVTSATTTPGAPGTTGGTTSTGSTPPTVKSQPRSLGITAGGTATFTATATGRGTKVQWQQSSDGRNFTNVKGAKGATSSTLTVKGGKGCHRIFYRAVFTNSAGTTTSSVVSLSVH